MGETKIDCRRRYTLSVIQEAFFALLAFGIVWILEKLADARQGQEGRWRI